MATRWVGKERRRLPNKVPFNPALQRQGIEERHTWNTKSHPDLDIGLNSSWRYYHRKSRKKQHGNIFLFRIKCKSTLRGGVSLLNHVSAPGEVWGALAGFQFLMEIVGDAKPVSTLLELFIYLLIKSGINIITHGNCACILTKLICCFPPW